MAQGAHAVPIAGLCLPGDGETDDELDIIDMTPRCSQRPSWTTERVRDSSFSDFPAVEYCTPESLKDGRAVDVAPSQAPTGKTSKNMTLCRDPSGHDHPFPNGPRDNAPQPGFNRGASGANGGNILENLFGNMQRARSTLSPKSTANDDEPEQSNPTRAATWNPRESPNSVMGDFTRNISKRSSAVFSQDNFLRIETKIIGFYDGELEHMMNETLFSGPNDPEAQKFASFLSDDGVAARIPVLCMSDYNIGDFAADLWTFPHNAIKRELFDMYDIVGALRVRYLQLTFGDLYKIRRWWRLFGVFWRQYCRVEKTLLQPLVRTDDADLGAVSPSRANIAKLADAAECLALKVEEITSYFEEFETLPRGTALSLICRATDAFGIAVLNLFNSQERLYPPAITKDNLPGVRLSIEVRTLEIFRDSTFFAESVVHYIRWLPAGRERDQWLATHLRWIERSNMAKYYKRYEASRGSIVSSFRNASRG